LSLALASGSLALAKVAHAETAQSNANTPRLALHKAELWLAVAEPKPATADLDAGMGATGAVQERLSMLNTEIGAVASRRMTLINQAAAYRRKAAELRAASEGARGGEHGIRRGNSDAAIAELEQKAASFDTQAEAAYETLMRLSNEERGLVDAVGRVRGITDMIGTSTIADATQKQKATTLGAKTIKAFQTHAAIVTTLINATQPTSS
jgi:hypothetical protein